MFLQKQLTLFKNHDGEFTFVYDAKAVFFVPIALLSSLCHIVLNDDHMLYAQRQK